ncbi:radical SAM protein [Acidianus brierleyi]|uniref:Radical SAM protein n=1 Tax=Acidianus brierleyi TaxID=41673 RepID=A0A2U9IFG6_9CREN|nr:radical SAM protein [Acidianus brierleyi]AWR94684.1 radical SAM protein [Acidianus brierleyi]
MLIGNPEIGVYNNLPKGCELCRLGGKLVVFISGECGDSCYYCPVSEERFDHDMIYANEKKVENFMDFVYESYKMNALGAGITGGDPILHLDRVVEVINILKDEFGDDFHIHLYTSGRYVTYDVLRELQNAGLDEIRFHPLNKEYLKAIEKALKFDFDVGIEVPSIPGKEKELEELIQWAKEKKVKFVNINELEITERNSLNLNAIGLKIDHGLAGASRSAELALNIVKKYHEGKMSVHYCSSIYKDIVETRTRFLRTFRVYSKSFEQNSGEGTIIRALVRTKANLEDYGEKYGDGYYVSPDLVNDIIKMYPVDEVKIIEELPYGLVVSEKLVYSKSQYSNNSS